MLVGQRETMAHNVVLPNVMVICGTSYYLNLQHGILGTRGGI